jgi:hypothetical protein
MNKKTPVLLSFVVVGVVIAELLVDERVHQPLLGENQMMMMFVTARC